MIPTGYREEASGSRLLIAGGVSGTLMLLFMLLALGIIPNDTLQNIGPLLEVDYVTVEEPRVQKPTPPPPRVTPRQVEKKETVPEPVEQDIIPEMTPLEATPAPQTAADVAAPPKAPSAPVNAPSNAPLRIGSTQELDNVNFEPIFNPKPDYPLIAQQTGITGYVDVDLVISDNGKVKSFSIVNVKGHPAFGTETAKVLPRWRFPPPRIDGKKTSVKYLYRIKFTLSAVE